MPGRSRQGAPDRKTQKIPLRTRRSFTRGTPRGLFGSIGLLAVHSQSASSYTPRNSFRHPNCGSSLCEAASHNADKRDGMALAKTWCHLTVDGLREQIKLEGR